MSRVCVVIRCRADAEKVARWAMKAPPLTRVEFKAPRRSIPQNDKMWAALTDVAEQLTWHGQKLSTDDWKVLFLGALKQELRLVPNLTNNGFVTLGRSSSDLSKAEMIDLIELIHAWGAEHGVQFQRETEAA
jgi:hypothetical protein